jgi:hypothetical protein
MQGPVRGKRKKRQNIESLSDRVMLEIEDMEGEHSQKSHLIIPEVSPSTLMDGTHRLTRCRNSAPLRRRRRRRALPE